MELKYEYLKTEYSMSVEDDRVRLEALPKIVASYLKLSEFDAEIVVDFICNKLYAGVALQDFFRQQIEEYFREEQMERIVNDIKKTCEGER